MWRPLSGGQGLKSGVSWLRFTPQMLGALDYPWAPGTAAKLKKLVAMVRVRGASQRVHASVKSLAA